MCGNGTGNRQLRRVEECPDETSRDCAASKASDTLNGFWWCITSHVLPESSRCVNGFLLVYCLLTSAVSALTLLVVRLEEHPACKN